MIGLFDGVGRRRLTRAGLRHQLAAATKDRDRLQAERDTARDERDEAQRLLRDAHTELRALRAEKAAAWAVHANAHRIDVPAPADDPASGFYSGQTAQGRAVMPLHEAPFAQPPAHGPVVRIRPHHDHTHTAA